MRTCRYCNREWDESEFPTANVVDGKRYLRHKCKECYKTAKSVYRNTQLQLYIDYKKTLKCERCGFGDYHALQFHHHNGDKEFSVGDAKTKCFSFETVKKEMEKCEVLCANCHQIEHYKEK